MVDYQNFKARWPLIERLRRWSHSADVDEIEIPIYVTPEITTSFDAQTTESNSTMVTTIEIVSDENSTIFYPLLRQDVLEINQTTISIIEDVLSENQTATMIDENREKNETDYPSTQVQFSSTSLIQDFPTTTTISDFFWNDTVTTVETTQEWSIQSNLSLKDASITSEDLFINETEIPIVPSRSTIIPTCDHSCECAKECPYGFEITNDTCLCDPPCKVIPIETSSFSFLFASFF